MKSEIKSKMSDRIKDLMLRYEHDVNDVKHVNEYPRSVGLFPIPEYPELEGRGMWSSALDILLTALRYLAPATLLTLFWGQQSFIFKLLRTIDSGFRAIVFSSEEQKQSVLKWLEETGQVHVERLETVWRHGWILCGVLDAALPGACAGHQRTRLSLEHAQAIADHYLGVEPVFSRQELESNDSLSKHQEWKLATYIDRIREALSKLTPPVSKPTSQRTSPESVQFTIDYVARGSGLAAAQVNHKMHFKIYPTSQQCMDPGEITILIKGPKDTCGMTVIPPILGKAQMIRQKLLGLQSKPNYTENALPVTQGVTYFRNFGKNNMNKTYYIPKSRYEIEIEEEINEDHARISYGVNKEGKYEIFITSRGLNIAGSPFKMTASKNILGILERESFCLEDGEEIDIVDVKNDRKVVLRIVDFVTEKMLLRENGTLQKISDEEAKALMSTDTDVLIDAKKNILEASNNINETLRYVKTSRFKNAAEKIVKMSQVCKIIYELTEKDNKTYKRVNDALTKPRTRQKDIPDVVNSTFNQSISNPFLSIENRDKYIIPKNMSASLRTEKFTYNSNEDLKSDDKKTNNNGMKTKLNSHRELFSPDSLERCETVPEEAEDILCSQDSSSNNPFLSETYEQNYEIEKDLGSFVKTEYETNNLQNEEIAPIKITVEESSENSSPTSNNPFIEPDIIHLERPKTPVLKIITGEVTHRDCEDSVYVDPSVANISDEIPGNEFINPFFLHHLQTYQLPVTDFIIGAPVSLPPIIRTSTPEPNMDSLIITDSKEKLNADNVTHEHTSNSREISSPEYSTPLPTISRADLRISSTYHSFDSNLSDNVEIVSLSNTSDNQGTHHSETSHTDRITPKKDMWDSAYVSIDETNSSPDNNNNDNAVLCETTSKQKFSLSDHTLELSKMGPAEREIWESCNDLKQETHNKVSDEIKPLKWDSRRALFTPILEESDRSISSSIKDSTRSGTCSKNSETETVTVAFAELNNIYREYFPKNTEKEKYKIDVKKNTDSIIERCNASIDSASEISDVKRYAKKLEGKISEVQSNVTESVSVSQTLQNYKLRSPNDTEESSKSRDNTHTNIVLEKKQYWDERIREIEATKTEEIKTQQKKKRLSSKFLRQNDSLTKRRGRQIVKKYLNSGEQIPSPSKKMNEIIVRDKKTDQQEQQQHKSSESSTSPLSSEDISTDYKLVEKWKKYWDEKLETEKDKTEVSCFRAKSPKSKETSLSPQQRQHRNEDLIEVYEENKYCKDKPSSSPIKQELPEEVFKAFETSPKRFFGTSRKQILNKIDTFLGKPSTADESTAGVSGAHHETGLVSSRISMFHNISQSEEIPWSRRKCQSMHNICQRKDSEKSSSSVDDKVNERKSIVATETLINFSRAQDKLTACKAERAEIDLANDKETKSSTLKEKRSILALKGFNKTFDESVYRKSQNDTKNQSQSVQMLINDLNKNNKQNTHHQKCSSQSSVLKKSSMSKSEMDIFTKITNKPSDDDDLDKYKSCDELPKMNVKNFISLYESVSKVDMKSKPQMPWGWKSSSLSSSSGAVNATSFKARDEVFTPEHHTDSDSTADLRESPINYWKKKSQESFSNHSVEPRSLDSVDIGLVTTHDLEKETTYLSLSDIELEIVETSDKTSNPTSEANVELPIPSEADYKSRFKMAKEFFQSLDEVTEPKTPKKLNECELLLENKSVESLVDNTQPPQAPKRTKKQKLKSHSMPSTEISNIWNQLQESRNKTGPSKFEKISEKFNVEDLFSDVTGGKLSRQGSLRGIPHKKAVLETFRSMENVSDKQISPYDTAIKQMEDMAAGDRIKYVQTYLSEYPYLPKTDPAKYQSRLDNKASGLITLKELKMNQQPRRSSVPELKINTKLSVNL